MAAATYITRAAFMVTLGGATLPAWAERGLRYVPVGVLTSLVVPQVVLAHGAWALRYDSPFLWGAIVSGLVAQRGASPLLAIVSGVAVVALVRGF
jgi:branched-subunit amino acid transport protein